jgi:hypothetical protein
VWTPAGKEDRPVISSDQVGLKVLKLTGFSSAVLRLIIRDTSQAGAKCRDDSQLRYRTARHPHDIQIP